MNYTQVKNPVWTNAEHTMIDCDVDFDDLNEEFVPFTANPLDTSNPNSAQIFFECANGIWGEVLPYIPPPPYVPTTDDNKQTAISLLQQTDWTTIADVGNPQMANPYLANQTDFIAYRNSVRQIALNPVAGNLDWPTLPDEVWQSA